MNYKQYFLVVVIGLIALSLFAIMYSWFWNSPTPCSNFKSIDASITIESAPRPIIGLNTDTNSLAFGTLSPTAMVKRSIIVNYSHEATVQVMMTGPLASWVTITPYQFNLPVAENKEVDFFISVPADTSDGSYNGTTLFCFRE